MSRPKATLGSIASVVIYALIPKCPLCVAAALSAFGISASIAPAVRPLLFVIAALMLAVSVRAFWRARRTCCGAVHSRE